jgi:YHS domain-containing protein
MLRFVLFLVLAIFVARAFWRILDGIVEGASGPRPRGQAPDRGVSMVRDPVCGTFVLPASAVTLVEGRGRLYFCSDACRDQYRARPSAGSGRR